MIGIHTPLATTHFFDQLISAGINTSNVSWINDCVDSFEINDKWTLFLPGTDYPQFMLVLSDEAYMAERTVTKWFDCITEVVSFFN